MAFRDALLPSVSIHLTQGRRPKSCYCVDRAPGAQDRNYMDGAEKYMRQ